MWLNQQQLKFSGTGASWKQLPRAPNQVCFLSDPYAAPQSTLEWKHWARELIDNLLYHSVTPCSYSVAVSSTSAPGKRQEQVTNFEEITEITEDSSISQELVPLKNSDCH